MKNLHCKLIMLVVATTCLIGSGYAQTCPDGMVSFWKFDDLSTDLFIDSYGNHDGESDISLTSVSGKVGIAATFSGTNVISVPNHADFAFTANSSFTVEFWVKYASYNLGRNQVIIGKKDSETTGAYWFLGIQNITGKVIFELKGSGEAFKQVLSSSSLSVNTWHHVVGIRDEATNTNKLYIDGVLDGTTTYDFTGDFISDGSITIGAFPNSSGVPAYFLEGSLDETAIYNRAISASEITDHILKGNNGIGYCDGFSPVIKSTPVTTAIVGQPYNYTVSATGMPVMTYTLLTGPEGMTIDGTTGTFSWTPASVDINAWVEVRASNSVAPADTQRFRIFLAEAPDCPDGISVLLKLNETSGPTYIDYYGSHNSTAVVAPTPTTGIIDGAQSFNSTTEIILPDNGEEFEWIHTSNWSIEFWMKTSTTGTMVAIGRHRKAADSPDKAKWWIGTNASGHATFSLQDNAATPKLFELSGTTPLSDNQWHHIIAVREGSSQENRLYVDGVRVNAVATNYANSFKADIETEIGIGYWKRDAGSEYHFVGAIDELSIFDGKAISDAEAAAFYNAGAPVGHCAVNNFAPVITSIPVTAAIEDAVYSYTFKVEDPDVDDLITLSAPTKPTWLNFNYTAGQKMATLTATPTNDQVGDHNVILRVFDGTVTKEQPFTITVTNVNDAPVITSTAILTGYVGTLYAYIFMATDADANTTLTYSAFTKPAWLNFDATTGILSGTPAQADKGQHLILLRVSDGTVTVEQSFTLVIDGPSAIDDLSVAGISIFPVPAKDYLTVAFSNLTEATQLNVISATGSIVKKVVIPARQNSYTLDLNGIETGLYYLHIKNNSINNISRFVITK